MLKKTETYLLIVKSVLLNTAKVVIYKQNFIRLCKKIISSANANFKKGLSFVLQLRLKLLLLSLM